MRLLGQFQANFFFFLKKILNPQKLKSNQNQLTKYKQVNKKQQRQKVFACTKTSKRVKVAFFCFLVLFYAQNFRKKNKLAWNCPNNLILLYYGPRITLQSHPTSLFVSLNFRKWTFCQEIFFYILLNSIHDHTTRSFSLFARYV